VTGDPRRLGYLNKRGRASMVEAKELEAKLLFGVLILLKGLVTSRMSSEKTLTDPYVRY
jgi:hypothetical protein